MHNSYLHTIERLKQQPRLGMPISNDPKKAEEEKRKREQAKQSADTLAGVGSEIVNLTKVSDALTESNIALSTGIQRLIGVQQSYGDVLKTAAEDATKLEQRNSGLQKSFGLNIEKAGDYGFKLEELSADMKMSRENLEKYIVGLNDVTAGFIASSKAGDAQIKTITNQQRYFTDILGVSEEAAVGLQGFAAAAGYKGNELVKSLEIQATEIENITGLKGVQRDIDEEIGTLSAEAQLQFGRMPATLGLAVMKTKAMGLSLDQLTKTGDSLLNIEQSVGDELELQLLTGTRLVKNNKSLTNEYRKYYLAGDAEKMASTLNDAYETQKKSLKTNMLARKQFEKTFGLEEGAVAKMQQREEIINKLRTDGKTKEELMGLSGDDLKAKIDELKKSGGLDIGTEDMAALMDTYDTRSTQEKQTELLAKMYTSGIIVNVKATGKTAGTLAKGTSDNLIDATKKLEPLFTSINKFSEVNAEAIGAVKQYTISLKSFKDTSETFVKGIPALASGEAAIGQGLLGLKDAIGKMLDKDGTIGKLVTTLTTGGKLPSMTVKTMNVESTATGVGEDDAVMINDGFVTFNPRDKFTRVNDGMTVAGTNVGGIDRFAAQMEKRDSRFEQTMTRLISNMAAQMKQAVESANIKVDVDRTFSGNSMNKGRYA